MAQKTAAIIRGDGTGPELVEAMIKVLRACDTKRATTATLVIIKYDLHV